MRYFVLVIMIMFSCNANASNAEKALEGFLNGSFHTNITTGGVYNDQRGGYITPGSIYMRTPTSNLQLMDIQMPSYRAGCGGIDAFTGGFSYINSDQLIRMLKNIASNSVAYGFNLVLQSFSADIAQEIKWAENAARKVNEMNINSCQAAQQLVNGALLKNESTNQYVCQSAASIGGKVADWAESRQMCGADAKRKEVLDNKGEQFKDIFVADYNLTWEVLKRLDIKDTEISKDILALMGTVIKKTDKTGEKQEPKFYPPLINNDRTVNSYMIGGTFESYECHDELANIKNDKCLIMKIKNTEELYEESIQGKIASLVNSITNKIMATDAAVVLTSAEEKLVNESNIPILKIAFINAALKSGGDPIISLNEYIEPIAENVLYNRFNNIIETLDIALAQYEQAQVNDEINEFRESLHKQRELIYNRRQQSFQRLITTMNLFSKIKALENSAYSIIESVERIQ